MFPSFLYKLNANNGCVLSQVQLFVTHGLQATRLLYHGVFQARILDWVAIFFSRESSWPKDQTHVSCIGRWILYPESSGKPLDVNIQMDKHPVRSLIPSQNKIIYKGKIFSSVSVQRGKQLFLELYLSLFCWMPAVFLKKYTEQDTYSF